MYSDDEQTAIKTDSVFRTFVSSDADFKSITQDKQVRTRKKTLNMKVLVSQFVMLNYFLSTIL